jgi:hypothetical protein
MTTETLSDSFGSVKVEQKKLIQNDFKSFGFSSEVKICNKYL